MKNKANIDTLAECCLIRYTRKTGKIDTVLSGTGYAMLCMWGLQNTPKSKGTVVFEVETGLVISAYLGTADGFPKTKWGEDGLNVETFIPGILNALNELK